MNTWEKLEESKNGRIQITVSGKETELRYTVHQMQRLEAMFSAEKDEETGVSSLSKVSERDIDILEIALNPLPDQTDFTREFIVEKLDLDQIKILAQYWLQKKVFNPSFEVKTASSKN